MSRFNFQLIAFSLAFTTALPLAAKDKTKPAAAQQDEISVAGHLAVPAGPIVGFVPTQHYDRTYVYAEGAPGQPATLLDVTDASRPKIVSQIAGSDAGNIVAVTGTAALASSTPAATAAPGVQTIRIMDFSDPARPRVSRQFDGVTAVQKLQNGVILLANADGVWVLRERLAEDPRVEASYAYKVIYGESMYH